MTTRAVDIAIIGGGVVGSFAAFFLRDQGFKGSIAVIEKDSTYEFASTTRSAASIRQQFTTPINVQMSQFSFEFLKDMKERFGDEGEIQLHHNGYLLLADTRLEEMLRSCHKTFVELGSNVAWYTPQELSVRFPYLNTEDLVGGTFGVTGEGWFDAYMLLQAIRKQARKAGVEYVDAEVTGMVRTGSKITSIKTSQGEEISVGTVINAAGPSAGAVAAMAGCELPVEPRKRTMFVISAPLNGAGMPMIFDTTGASLRPEGDQFICGVYPTEDRDPHPGNDFEPDHYLFEETLWPALAHRIPALESLRLQRPWCGHYDMNLFDHNGIIGAHPEVENFVFANGFSGHGVMHAPATGRAVAELITHGKYVSLDVSDLSYERIAANRPIVEKLVY